MRNMDKWLGELKSAKSAIESAQTAMQDIRTWVNQNVVATDVIPHKFPLDLDEPFQVLHESLRNAVGRVAGVHDTLEFVLFKLLSGQRLSKEQFHLIGALGLSEYTNYTNKDVGLSDYDDYEVYEQFCYESDEKHAYISPNMKPFSTRIRSSGRPPEDIPWESLRQEQRLFFERHFPEVAARFKRTNQLSPSADDQ